jgi:DNA-3-methyladenine glycosylase II
MYVLRVSSLGEVDRPRLLVELLGDATPDDLPAAAALTHKIFATSDDITPLYRAVEADPVFARLAWSLRGLRPVLIADPFEAIVWAIIGQQINISFAAKMKRALVERFGSSVAVGGLVLPTFPAPERLAELDHERDLLPIQFSRQKSRYCIALARAVRDGDIDLAAVGQLPAEAAITTLTALPGIGRWTAEYALMRAFGHRDVMPAGDGGLKQIIGREYGYGRLATEAEVRAHGEAWAGWRAYAAFYWWFTLQVERRRRSAGQSAVVNGQPTVGV